MTDSASQPPRLERLLAFIGRDPGNFILRVDAIRAAYAAQEWGIARALIDAGLAINPDQPQLHGLLALLMVELEQERSDAAKLHIDAALSHDPTQAEALLARASLYSERQDYRAEQGTLELLLEAHPDCGRAWLALGQIKFRATMLDAARHDFELAARYMPTHVGTWHLLAWTCILLRDIPVAERSLQSALDLDRNFGETHGGLAVVAALQGREADARALIKRSLRLNVNSMSAQYARILLLQREGRQEEARAVFEEFLARPVARSDRTYRDLVANRLHRVIDSP